jgi:hypothetical protein
MTACRLCGKTIKRKDEFILEGKYPGLGKRCLNSVYGMDFWGDCYHKSCYIEKIKK